jgi:hypothetical protein
MLSPLVLQPIRSKAENQCLKQLIERFAEQRDRLERGQVRDLDELFSTSTRAPPASQGRGAGRILGE